MTKIIDLYNDFVRIDLDARGGYARVADVVTHQEDGSTAHRAFKLMRHELGDELDGKQIGLQRFENELRILIGIDKDESAPSAITRIYDSGFVAVELSKKLHELQKGHNLNPNPNLEIVSTGKNFQKFLDVKSALMEKEPGRWLPYLVVELAPYNDSLLRQIHAQSGGDFLNLYELPVITIVEMALQILDVIDYLHKKLHFAYIDWKPEHIYWNEASRQLKLIDWNVTTPLNGGLAEKRTIREDIRMFCGAALYCSLALTDPEALTRPIGTIPSLRKDKPLVPVIPPRYWTDNPNFYQRDDILDEEIKQIVKKALDPSQGFNSPQELKSALVQYNEDLRKSGEGELINGVPYEAVQHYRRARSYIAASDFSFAIKSLKRAIASVRVAGASYQDAEQLLTTVQDLLKANEFKQRVKLVLDKGQWNDALGLYAETIALDPTNMLLKYELGGLQSLLDAESKLRRKNIFKVFMSPKQLQTTVEAAEDVVGSDNPLLNYVKEQLSYIKTVRTRFFQIGVGSATALFVGILALSFLPGGSGFSGIFPVATATLTNTPTRMASITPHAMTISPSLMPTVPPMAADTLEPSITPITVLGYGKLTQYVYPVREPNGEYIDIKLVLDAGQPVTVIDRKVIQLIVWYKCNWEIDGTTSEGWFQEKYIQFGPPPTATP